MMTSIRPCERQCRTCGQRKHYSRFHHWKVESKGTRAPTIRFAPDCLDCQQKRRNEQKNEDRPYAIIRRRAADHARKAGVPVDFFWINLNYRALVPIFRAMMTPEGLCTSCGHPFDNERDAQIEHREPPRHARDWARRHARNCDIGCTNCNRRKGPKPYAQWLDDEEETRLSNEASRHDESPAPSATTPEQLALDWTVP